MAPPRPPKLSGAELAAQLAGTVPSLTVPPSSPTPPNTPPVSTRTGRPNKSGGDGIPVNVQLAQTDHVALAKIAAELLVPGRPMPTVQDVVRGLIRGALKDPAVLMDLVRKGEA